MKPTSEWDLTHIVKLPPGEFDWVEFKGRKGLDITTGVDENKVLEDLSRQLSAFANSGGGVLVYGIFNPLDHKQRYVDDGGIHIALKKPSTREWLEDVISNLVEFPLKKFNVYTLTKDFGAPELASDRCIILIDVPDSEDAPHQARDQRYYARVGGKSRPVGHRIVTDMFHRGRHALFEVSFRFDSHTWIPQPMFQGSYAKTDAPRRTVKLGATAQNKGKVYAKYVDCRLWLPECIVAAEDKKEGPPDTINGKPYYVRIEDNTRRDVLKVDGTFGTRQYGPSWFDPILPGLQRSWEFDCNWRLGPEGLSDDEILWVIHCDNAPAQRGRIALKNIPFEVRDEHRMVF